MPRYFFVAQDNFLLIVVEWGIYKIFGAPCPGNSTIFLLFNKTFHMAKFKSDDFIKRRRLL